MSSIDNSSWYSSVLGKLILGTFAAGVVGQVGIRYLVSRKWAYYGMSSRSVVEKTIVVTGGNAGLGYQTALRLAKEGARVILACRDSSKGTVALNNILKQCGNLNDQVYLMNLDLGSLESVMNFAKALSDKYTSIDTLVLNAGVWIPMEKGVHTTDGYEVHFGTNHLGHWLLVRLLRTKVDRVVWVSSALMNGGVVDMESKDFVKKGRRPNPEAKRSFAPTGYSDSKLMNGLTAAASKDDVFSVAVCPGFCKTELGRHVKMSPLKKLGFFFIGCCFQRSSYRGSHNILHPILEEKSNLVSGGFYRETKIAQNETDKIAKLAQTGQELIELSEKLVLEHPYVQSLGLDCCK